MKVKIGKNAYIGFSKGKNDYFGMTGKIVFCKTCCRKNRIQFDNIANSELLSSFDIRKCEIIN